MAEQKWEAYGPEKGASMTRDFRVAGWLSIANAALTLPIIFIAGAATLRPELVPRLAIEAVGLLNLALFVFVFSELKRLVAMRDFHDVDALIFMLIGANSAVEVWNLAGAFLPDIKDTVRILSIASLIPVGITFVLFAVRLLHFPTELSNLLKGFCYAIIVTGICAATVVLLPISFISSIVADVTLGLIFLRAREFLAPGTDVARRA